MESCFALSQMAQCSDVQQSVYAVQHNLFVQSQTVGGQSPLEEGLILDCHADLQEGYAQQLSVRAGEVLVTELQMCQMQVCL